MYDKHGNKGRRCQVKDELLGKFHDLHPQLSLYADFRAVPEDRLWIPLLAGWIPLYALGYGSLCLVYLMGATRFYFGTSSKWVFDKFL